MNAISTNMPDQKNELSLEDIEARKRWQELGSEDEKLIIEIGQLVGDKTDDLIETIYSHFLAYPQTKKFFPDEATLKRAQAAQAQYFLRLTKGNYDQKYVLERLRIGSTHYRIGLDMHWYLAAYGRVLSWFCKQLIEHFRSDTKKSHASINALTKIIFFDMSLALDAYFNAKEEAIKQHRDSIAELETGRRITKSILENAPVGIMHLDLDFNYIECNKEFLQIAKVSRREQLIGKNLFSILPYLPKEPFEQVRTTGQPYRQMAAPLNFSDDPDAPVTYWDWASWPIKDEMENISGIVTQFVSATDRVLLQQQREDFVATLSHDLKTPILAANRAIKLLLEGDFGTVSETQSNVLGTIYESNESLYKLVLTLLDVYRYDSGAMQLAMQPHDLCRTINTLVDELQPLAAARNIELSAQLPQSVQEIQCDAAEIKRVIQNLVDNALKFTPAGGSVTIHLQQTLDMITILVNDTGKGIVEEDKPKLFQRFWQAASGGRYYASTGLGLYLCRKIVELHGGRIWCESTLGEGSTFAFFIPMAEGNKQDA